MAEVTAEEVADVLDKAHDVLLVDGWGQNTAGHRAQFNNDTQSACLVQAINRAMGEEDPLLCCSLNEPEAAAAGWAIIRVLSLHRRTYDGPVDPLWRWNDESERTIDDVLDAFRITAKKLRNGEVTV